MKIISKIKKVLISAGIIIIALPKKVFGISTKNIGNQTAYGVKTLEDMTTLKVIRFILIPLILLIGIIIYWNKSKESTKTKIIRSAIVVLLVAGLIGLITYWISSVS